MHRWVYGVFNAARTAIPDGWKGACIRASAGPIPYQVSATTGVLQDAYLDKASVLQRPGNHLRVIGGMHCVAPREHAPRRTV